MVSIVNAPVSTSATYTVVTGLPKPLDFTNHIFFSGAGVFQAGMQYWNNQWQFGKFSGTGGVNTYGSFTYLTDE